MFFFIRKPQTIEHSNFIAFSSYAILSKKKIVIELVLMEIALVA